MTALALAAKGGYDDIVTELLDQGAYLNVLDKVILDKVNSSQASLLCCFCRHYNYCNNIVLC